MKVFQTYQELKDYYIRNWVMQVPGNFCLVDEDDERRTSWDYLEKERNLRVKNGKEYFVLKKC